MKTLIFVLLSLVSYSCEKETNDEAQFLGEWVPVNQSGNAVITGHYQDTVTYKRSFYYLDGTLCVKTTDCYHSHNLDQVKDIQCTVSNGKIYYRTLIVNSSCFQVALETFYKAHIKDGILYESGTYLLSTMTGELLGSGNIIAQYKLKP